MLLHEKKDSENCIKNDFMNIFLLSIACYNKRVNFLIDILSSLFFITLNMLILQYTEKIINLRININRFLLIFITALLKREMRRNLNI